MNKSVKSPQQQKELERWVKNMNEAFEYQKLQQEQQHQMIDTKAGPSQKSVTVNNSTLSVKAEVSNKKEKREKGKKKGKKIFVKQSSRNSLKTVKYRSTKINPDEREKLLENYLRNSAEKRKTIRGFLRNNIKVGITEYVSHNQGFSARKGKIKFKTDFQVRPLRVILDEADQMGELKDHFDIALRNVIGEQCHIETCLKSLGDVGFLNYFESRKFGLLGDQHLIGNQLLLERWQEAIDLIFEELFKSKYPTDFALACFEYKCSRDVHKALDMIERAPANSIPGKILSSIKLHGGNLAEAVNTAVPLDVQRSYVHAYQCFIWNQIVSKRIAKFGSKLIVGDLVYAPSNNNNEHDNQRKVIFIDDGNIHEYTIYDVVLPLPTHDSIYPANEVAGWYIDLFQADGISEMDFNLKSKTLGLGGAYRPMMLRPSDLKWKFIRYDNDNQKLITSDLERLQQIPVGSLLGAYLGLVLEFSLPKFAYGSMALREILKMDMTEAFRNALQKKQLCPNQERPSSLASECINEPQIREIEENPCCITEHPLLENNIFFIDSCPASATSDIFQASPLRKIKLESDLIEKQPSRDNLTERPTCSSSNNESHLKGITFGEPDTIGNLLPLTRKLFEEPQVKKEPGATKRPASIIKDSSEEPQKNRTIPERSTSNQMPQLMTVNEFMKEPQTKCIKEEPSICRTRKSNFTESFEEPAEKKIKADPDAKQKEFPSKVSTFKSIVYIDLASDEED